jgi:hypothetical protein
MHEPFDSPRRRMSSSTAPRPWRSALLDLVAFVIGLGVAYARGWSTTDLIWSLWLSSLVVGYALIVWAVAQPALELFGIGWRHRADVQQSPAWTDKRQLAVLLTIALLGAALYLAFFTMHFGGFHYIQSLFLLSSYPLGFELHSMNRATFWEVVRRYWLALPSAFLARRYAFARRTFAERGVAHSRVFGPYQQVMRMQVVIIAFGAVHAARRESFLVYALIYALYFFPWGLVRERFAARSDAASGADSHLAHDRVQVGR